MDLQEEAEKKPTEVEPADMAFMEELADRTERLWGALSATIAAVEADVARSQTSAPEGAAHQARACCLLACCRWGPRRSSCCPSQLRLLGTLHLWHKPSL